jgi:hypothetical protein
MLNTNQTDVLAQKLKTIFEKFKVDYNGGSKTFTVNNKSFTVPKNPKQVIYSRSYLNR